MDTISNNRKNAYFLLCLVAVLVVPVYSYGLRPVILALIGLITAALRDFVFNRFFHLP